MFFLYCTALLLLHYYYYYYYYYYSYHDYYYNYFTDYCWRYYYILNGTVSYFAFNWVQLIILDYITHIALHFKHRSLYLPLIANVSNFTFLQNFNLTFCTLSSLHLRSRRLRPQQRFAAARRDGRQIKIFESLNQSRVRVSRRPSRMLLLCSWENAHCLAILILPLSNICHGQGSE